MKTDFLGKELNINDLVVYTNYNSFSYGKITKINPKQATILKLNNYLTEPFPASSFNTVHKYYATLIKLDEKDVFNNVDNPMLRKSWENYQEHKTKLLDNEELNKLWDSYIVLKKIYTPTK